MTKVAISVRIDKSLYGYMKLHDEINWSAILQNSIKEQLEKLERIDVERAQRAAKGMDKLRESGAFSRGKPSVEIIREWREKRRQLDHLQKVPNTVQL